MATTSDASVIAALGPVPLGFKGMAHDQRWVAPSTWRGEAMTDMVTAVAETSVLLWRAIVCVADRDFTARLSDGLTGAGYLATFEPELCSISVQLAADEPAVVVIDDQQPGWVREVADLVRVRPMARPVVLLSSDDDDSMLTALWAGVAGFCAADASIEAVVRTVESVRESGVAIPRAKVAPLVARVRGGRRHVQAAAGQIEVTEREWEILNLLVQRHTTREMADALFVSVGTVRSHVSMLCRKLGADDRDDIATMFDCAKHA